MRRFISPPAVAPDHALDVHVVAEDQTVSLVHASPQDDGAAPPLEAIANGGAEVKRRTVKDASVVAPADVAVAVREQLDRRD